MPYYHVLISAEQTARAHRIRDALIDKQLVFGGPLVGRPAKILGHFKDSDIYESMPKPGLLTLKQDYNYIVTYTRENLKEELVAVAAARSRRSA